MQTSSVFSPTGYFKPLSQIIRDFENFYNEFFNRLERMENLLDHPTKEITKREIIQLICKQGEFTTYLRDFDVKNDDPLEQEIYTLLNVPMPHHQGTKSYSLLKLMIRARNKFYHDYLCYTDREKNDFYLEIIGAFKEKQTDVVNLINLLKKYAQSEHSQARSFQQYHGSFPEEDISYRKALAHLNLIKSEINELLLYNVELLKQHPLALVNFFYNIGEGFKIVHKWSTQRRGELTQAMSDVFNNQNRGLLLLFELKVLRNKIAHNVYSEENDSELIRFREKESEFNYILLRIIKPLIDEMYVNAPIFMENDSQHIYYKVEKLISMAESSLSENNTNDSRSEILKDMCRLKQDADVKWYELMNPSSGIVDQEAALSLNENLYKDILQLYTQYFDEEKQREPSVKKDTFHHKRGDPPSPDETDRTEHLSKKIKVEGSSEVDEEGRFHSENITIEHPSINIPSSKKGLIISMPVQDQTFHTLMTTFSLGEAKEGGDCFFDALAQTLNNIDERNRYTAEILRFHCFTFYEKNKEFVDELNKKDKLTTPYERIQYTVEECEPRFKDGRFIWGRTFVEGIILCRYLQLEAILVIEILQDPETHLSILSYYLTNTNTYEKINEEKALVWSEKKVPILAVEQNSLHFVPLLHQRPEPLPYSIKQTEKLEHDLGEQKNENLHELKPGSPSLFAPSHETKKETDQQTIDEEATLEEVKKTSENDDILYKPPEL